MDIDIEEIRQLKEDVSAIRNAIVGNSELQQEGLAQQVKKNAEYIESDKSFKSKAVGFLTALQVGAAFLFDQIFHR
jgi:RNase adaptor protein for sRNA GlmZ degradation